MDYFLSAAIGYTLGCIQTAFLLGKTILGKDIRDFGNGNAGASNATLVFGKKYGALTAAVDILKGVVAVVIVKVLYGFMDQESLWKLLYVAGTFAILGHNFPFYMHFKGGKGTATTIGVLLGMDYRLGLLTMLIMLVIVLISDYITIGTLSLIVVMLIYTFIFHPYWLNVLLVIILAGMSIYKHRKNFAAIQNGTEKKVRSVLFDKKKD